MDWISVEDRLPTIEDGFFRKVSQSTGESWWGIEVLTLVNCGYGNVRKMNDFIFTKYGTGDNFEPDKFKYFQDDECWVSYWLPIPPEPPKEDEAEE